MPNKIGSTTSRYVELDGARCLPWPWSRFSYQRTVSEGGRKVYREMVVDNFISHSVPAPCTHREVVEQIAKNSRKRIPVDSLPNDLATNIFPRGQTIFGFSGDRFDQIARNYKDMWWWVSKRGLRMEVVPTIEINLSSFDALAGKLMREAKSQRLGNGRLPAAIYTTIGLALDRNGFKPVHHLEGRSRKSLAERNQKHPFRAVHTFDQALKLPWLRTAVKRRLYRAADKFNKAHPQLSGL